MLFIPRRVMPRFEQRAQAGGLERSGHATTTLDGVADTPDLDAVSPGHSGRKRLNAPAEIGDDDLVNLAHRGLGHKAAELGESFRADYGFIGPEIVNIDRGSHSLRLVAFEEFVEGIGAEG